jgi:aryl-alcohol dehydrogenase-like predicted oxidoreductase
MRQTRLGGQGFTSSAIALGCMSMSDPPARTPAAEQESIDTILEAVDSGVTLLDTGDFYGMGHNEMLIGRAIRGRRNMVQLAVKFGALRDHRGNFIGFNGRPDYVKASLAYSLQRLGTDHIDFYFPARVDPSVGIEETIGAVSDLIREGKVRYAGLSEASAGTIRRAHSVHPISAVEIEYSLWSRDIEDDVLPTARELGIGVLAYSALSRGLLTGSITLQNPVGATDFRAHFPRFQGENLEKNLGLVDRLMPIAANKVATVPQIAIAWVLRRGEEMGNSIVPVVGTKQRRYLKENLGALHVQLTDVEMAEIEKAIPRGIAAGTRYPAAGMSQVNV